MRRANITSGPLESDVLEEVSQVQKLEFQQGDNSIIITARDSREAQLLYIIADKIEAIFRKEERDE